MSTSLRRGLAVLAGLAEKPVTASDVAAQTGTSLSTAVRLLQVLEQEGFARRDDAARYYPGAQLLRVAFQASDELDVRQIAGPVLRELHRQTEQTIHLGYFDNPTLIYLDKYTGKAPVQMYSQIGMPAPLHCTAMGKAVAAYLPDDERTALATSLEYRRLTARTIRSRTAYLRELDRVRANGYALNLGEHEELISAVAVPLVRPDGRVHHAIDLAVPNFLVDENKLRTFIPPVVSAAGEISRLLGYR